VSAVEPRSQTRARPGRHRLLTVLGIALVAVFVLGEVLLVRSYSHDPADQRLIAFLGALALLMAAGLAIVIGRAIRGDFARARDMLESSEARFQQLVEQFPAVVYALSLPEDGRPPLPVYVSPQMMAITGVSAEETMRRGLKWLSGHVPEDDQWGLGVAISAAVGGSPLPPMEFRFIKPSGEEIWLRASSTAVTDGPEGRRLQGLVFDITETMRARDEHALMETELRLAQKLEAVGQLAAGIAHEINTPVQFVGDTVSFLREAFGDLMELQPAQAAVNRAAAAGPVPAELLERVRAAEDHADLPYLRERVPAAFARASDGLGRVASIVGAMREFAHPPTSEQLAFDLNDALRNTLIVAANAYKYIADVTTDFGTLPPVLCNGGDMNQVFINLIVNAAHAIEDHVGESGERGSIAIHTRHDGDHVIVSITDTGGGIPRDVAERIFDPFFTTKDVGRGTGQGLAIARTIVVERHGGTLTFDSDPGRGSSFHVRLPVAGLQPTTEPDLAVV
jgi:PAS domain S-box-containing protein